MNGLRVICKKLEPVPCGAARGAAIEAMPAARRATGTPQIGAAGRVDVEYHEPRIVLRRGRQAALDKRNQTFVDDPFDRYADHLGLCVGHEGRAEAGQRRAGDGDDAGQS